MGFGIKELVIILVIIMLLFGTKKLKNMGADLGGALKGFKESVGDDAPNALVENVHGHGETPAESLKNV
ncbi:MAG: Sec-independent protein translocase subunit TatA [Pseudomonadales bacterium]|nr:Sec-independent protein translocase subunit TatA [Pseudomonadales bacterium]